MWAELKYRVCMALAKIGILQAYLVCERCGKEVNIDNADAHDAYFHGGD